MLHQELCRGEIGQYPIYSELVKMYTNLQMKRLFPLLTTTLREYLLCKINSDIIKGSTNKQGIFRISLLFYLFSMCMDDATLIILNMICNNNHSI